MYSYFTPKLSRILMYFYQEREKNASRISYLNNPAARDTNCILNKYLRIIKLFCSTFRIKKTRCVAFKNINITAGCNIHIVKKVNMPSNHKNKLAQTKRFQFPNNNLTSSLIFSQFMRFLRSFNLGLVLYTKRYKKTYKISHLTLTILLLFSW